MMFVCELGAALKRPSAVTTSLLTPQFSNSEKLFLTSTITFRTLGLPTAVVPSAPQPSAESFLKEFLGACWLSEVQWTVQIAGRVEILLSPRCSYQQKPDGASLWLHYLCEIGFSPRKLKDLCPPPLPGGGTKQTLISLILAGAIYFTINLLPFFSPCV